MAIYKRPVGYKHASIKQGIYWGLWGFIAGVYCFQPLLKRTHREENSLLYEYVKRWGEDPKEPEAEKPS